jgi:3'-phosphoadenosine 5'-phosphosulfate sulfotransferase (PAPS reductase)/FAD synthetase
MNPYRISGPAQVCFSGGRTSGYMLRRILDAHDGVLPSDVHVVFQNTGKEREQTLAFIHECETRWRVPITWLEWDGFDGVRSKALFKVVSFETASRKGEPFAKLIEQIGMLPNPIARICTANLKVKTSAAYMRSLGFDEWDSVMGIRADEPRRVARMNAPGRDTRGGIPVLPLAQANVAKRDVLAFWKAQPFDLMLDPQGDLGNCDLCFLKSRAKLVSAIQSEPHIAQWWIEQETKHRDTMGRAALFRVDRPEYSELLREAMFYARQIPLDFDDEPLIDCMCGD